jgi:hypothetical protein
MAFFGRRDLDFTPPVQNAAPGAGAVSGDEAGLGEVFRAAWGADGVGGPFVSSVRRTEQAYDERIDAIFKVTGIRLLNPLRIDMRHLGQRLAGARTPEEIDAIRHEGTFEGFDTRLRQLAEQHPHLLAIIDPDNTPRKVAGERKRVAEEQLASALARSPWTVTPNIPILGPTPLNPAALAAGLGQGVTDPFMLATMPLMLARVGQGAGQVVWQGVKSGAVNAGAEVAQQPLVQAWRKDAGLDYGWDQAKHAIAGAALFGFAIDAGGRGAFRGVQRARGQAAVLDADGGVAGWRPREDLERAAAAKADPMAALEETARAAPEGSPLRRAVDGDPEALREVAIATGAAEDPAVRGALTEFDNYRLFGPPPEVEPHEHLVRLAEALQRARDPEAPAPGSAIRVPPETARTLDADATAALQRLRDQDGSALDLAAILRDRPDLPDASVPITDRRLRQAAGLAKLSDEAFERVAAGEIAPNYAALVGDLVADQSAHAGIVRAVAGAGLRNAGQVRMLIGELTSRAGEAAPHLARMGGSADAAAAAGARVKALDAALKALGRNARIAGVIDRELGRLEAALPEGSRGDARLRAGLQKRLTEAVRALVQVDSHVAELVADAAYAVSRGVKAKVAAEGLSQRLAAAIEADGVEGLVKPRRAADRLEGRGIDDPFGPEAQTQVKALDERVKFAIGDGKRRGGGDGGRGLPELPEAAAGAGAARARPGTRGQRGAAAGGAVAADLRPSYRDGAAVRTVKLDREFSRSFVAHLVFRH